MDRSGPGGKSSDTSEREPSLFHSLATCRPLCPSGKESPRLQGRLGGLPRRKKRGLGGGQTGSCRIQCPLPQSCCSFTSRSRGRPLLPLPFPFPLPQLKAGWKAFAGWPQLLCPCPEGGASAFAPPELWLAGSPPIPWGCCCRGGGEGHGSGNRAGTCSAKRARGRVLRPVLGESSGIFRPGRHSSARCQKRPWGEKPEPGPGRVWAVSSLGRSPHRAEPGCREGRECGPPPTHSRPRLPARGERGGESWVGRGVR